MSRIGILTLIFASLTCEAQTQTGNVIYVARRLGMSRQEVNAQEFFLDIGSEHGLKVGDVLRVERTVPIEDGLWGGAVRMLPIKVAEVEVFSVGPRVSAARLKKPEPFARFPAQTEPFVLLGDEVTLEKSNLPSP